MEKEIVNIRLAKAQEFIKKVSEALPDGRWLEGLDDYGDYSFQAFILYPFELDPSVLFKGYRLCKSINLKQISAVIRQVAKDFPEVVNLQIIQPKRLYRNAGTKRRPDYVYEGYDKDSTKIIFEIHKS